VWNNDVMWNVCVSSSNMCNNDIIISNIIISNINDINVIDNEINININSINESQWPMKYY